MGECGLLSFPFSSHLLSSLNDLLGVFSLGGWKQGWGQKAALSRCTAQTPGKLRVSCACCHFPYLPHSTKPFPSSAGKAQGLCIPCTTQADPNRTPGLPHLLTHLRAQSLSLELLPVCPLPSGTQRCAAASHQI